LSKLKKENSKLRKAAAAATIEMDDSPAEEDVEVINQAAGNHFGPKAHGQKGKGKNKGNNASDGNNWIVSRETTRILGGNRRIIDPQRLSLVAKQTIKRAELDSHANTCCTGANSTVIEYTGVKVSVHPFTDTYHLMKDVPKPTVATAYDCPSTCPTYLLIINEALYFGKKLQCTVLCPNQLRDNNVKVDDTPRQYNLN
jgi:hypothetical protein